MAPLTLVIGTKNYSSWSLRAWLVLRKSGIPFEERLLELSVPSFDERISRDSPSGRVPALIHGSLHVWDSLAIAEYVAELAPEARLWPESPADRAVARSVSAEMHSGFAALRAQMPMNLRARRRVPMTEELQSDIDRVRQIWHELRQAARSLPEDAGPWLFGRYSIADAMFAPVAARFATYGVPCEGLAGAYRDAVLSDPQFVTWRDAALSERQIIDEDEAGEPV